MREQIKTFLNNIKIREGAKILFAVETGSRLWRIESKDSDYDIRFVYVRKLEDYLRINKLRDVIEFQSKNMDFVGFDIYKFVKLLLNSNPSIIEWLKSDITYYDDGKSKKLLLSFIEKNFNPISLYHHYKSMCKSNYLKYIKSGNLMTYKKYLYALRGLINAKWVLKKNRIPPTNFLVVKDSPFLPQKIKSKLNEVLDLKKKGREKDIAKNLKIFDEYIENFLKEEPKILSKKIIDYSEIQNYILQLVKKG